MDPLPLRKAKDADALERAINELVRLVRTVPAERWEEFRLPVYAIFREANRLRRERDESSARAAFLAALVRYRGRFGRTIGS